MRSLEPGRRLRRTREALGLTSRDVEEASRQIASRQGNDEFIIVISRLSEIENRGAVPSIYRIYSLCAAYRLDPAEVMRWYGADPAQLVRDSTGISIDRTHPARTPTPLHAEVPVPLLAGAVADESRTTFLSRLIERWGRMPLALAAPDVPDRAYGWIGWNDWSMYPILQPGALVSIDESRTRIARSGWINEHDRPIYFLEHRGGWICGWCSLDGPNLLVMAHPASQQVPRTFAIDEIEVLGQVTGVAMRFTHPRRSREHSATTR